MIGSIDMRSIGQYVISDLYMRPKGGDGTESIWVERLTLDVAWSPPVSVRITSIKAEQPVLRIGNRLFDIFLGEDNRADESASDQAKKPDYDLPALDIRNGDAKLRVGELPPADFRFSARTASDGRITSRLEKFRAGKVALHAADAGDAQLGGFTTESLEVDFLQNLLSTKMIEQIRLESPQLVLSPGSLTPYREVSDAKPQEASDTTTRTETGSAGATQAPAALKDWSVHSLLLSNGLLTISGFPSETPVAEMAFYANLKNLGLAGDFLSQDHEVTVSNLRVSTSFAPAQHFLSVPEAVVSFQIGDLLQRKVGSLHTRNASLKLDRAFRAMVALRNQQTTASANAVDTPRDADQRADGNQSSPEPSSESLTTQSHWVIKRLGFEDTEIMLADLGAGVPDIHFRLPSSAVSEVALSGDSRTASDSVETVELADIVLYSPLDPFTPVVTLPSVFVQFSLAGLFRREINSLLLLHPTVYVSKDLFWFIDRSRQDAEIGAQNDSENAPVMDWKLGDFKIAHGRLAIATQGANRLALPLPFETHAQNISFTNFSDLRLDLKIEVPSEDYRFPSYQLELLGLSGSLRFGLPAGSSANNLVNTLTSDEVVWRQFRSGKSWVSVTYDVDGIYGRFGADAYGGYLEGGFTFFMNAESSWIGWASGTNVDLEKFTDVATPGNLHLKGQGSIELQVNADGPKIQRVLGNFATTGSGLLAIPKLEEIVERLPSDWSSLKRDITRIGIDALREFRYEEGNAKFWFIDKHGRLNMTLTGAEGSRKFDVVLHDTPFTAPMLWEQSFDLSSSIQLGQSP